MFSNGTVTGYFGIPARAIISEASNIHTAKNPAFTASDFLSVFPAFKNTADPVPETCKLYGLRIPDKMFDELYEMADASINIARWRSKWLLATCYYIAHYATLYLSATSGIDTDGVVASSTPTMVATSKSVGEVSVSYDSSSVTEDLKGWGDLKTTTYGVQLASWAKMLGIGGMMVW